MADAKRAIFVSDLHIGSNPALEDFVRDEELVKLLEAPEAAAPPGGECDLVLLGDTFDLWQGVADEECGADAKRVPIEYGAPDERARLERAMTKHPKVVAALGAFARRERTRLVVVPGNHDHSLVNSDVVAALANALGSGATLVTPWCYENETLGVYAEHGNQYDENNAYDDFGRFDWREDARGYYFVRLFFNRIERKDPRIENSPSGWRAVWYWIRKARNLPLLAYAIRCFAEYARDPRVRHHLVLAAAGVGGGPAGAELVDHPEAPLLLVRGAGEGDLFFSSDPQAEQFLRDAYRDSPEVRDAVREVLAAQGRGGELPPQGPAPVAAAPEAVFGPPKDVEWAARLWDEKPAFRDAPLDKARFQAVIFGHTHGELTQILPNGKTYLNTGSWTVWNGGGTVVTADAGPAGAPAIIRRRHFDGARFVD